MTALQRDLSFSQLHELFCQHEGTALHISSAVSATHFVSAWICAAQRAETLSCAGLL